MIPANCNDFYTFVKMSFEEIANQTKSCKQHFTKEILSKPSICAVKATYLIIIIIMVQNCMAYHHGHLAQHKTSQHNSTSEMIYTGN